MDERSIILSSRGMSLEGERTVTDFGIKEGSKVAVMIRVMGGCFRGKTMVDTGSGSKRLEDMREGDAVLTYNLDSGSLEVRAVQKLERFEVTAMARVKIGPEVIECTPTHPFYVPERGWCCARLHPNSPYSLLAVGDRVLTSSLGTLPVESIEMLGEAPAVVYTLLVEGVHNFFVQGLLVHNMQFFVALPNGTTVSVEVGSKAKVLDVKDILQRKSGIPREKQILRYHDKELQNDETLRESDFKDNTLELEEKQEVRSVRVRYERNTFEVKYTDLDTIDNIKNSVADLTQIPLSNQMLFYGGAVLENGRLVASLGLPESAELLLIPSTQGGSVLQFMQLVSASPGSSAQDLLKALEFLPKEKVQPVMDKATAHVAQQKRSHAELQHCDATGLIAITVWTSNLLFKQINTALRGEGDISAWRPYIGILLVGLRELVYHKGTVFRGLKNFRELSQYPKNKIICWPTISAMSKHRECALKFTDQTGILFEVEVLSGRDVSKLSVFPKEAEVLVMPYSHFEVVDVVDSADGPAVVKMREVPVPRGKKVAFWVDDNPHNNFQEIRWAEKEGISVVCCQSTEEACRMLNSYSWLLHLNSSDFRVVTDMVRVEGGKTNYHAGIEVTRKLRQDYFFGHRVLIYCKDEEAAKKNCASEGLTDGIYVIKSVDKLKRFLQFQPME